MKNILSFIAFFLVSYTIVSQVLKSPESVVYDMQNNRYFVSNANNGKTGGSIVILNAETQELSEFINKGVDSPKGLVIVGDILYCTDVKSVKGFNLSDGIEVFNLGIPDAVFLNDITSDGLDLYISDNAIDKIFRIDLVSGKVGILNTGSKLKKPNGLLLDKDNNRLLICSFRANSPIQSFDLSLNILSVLTETNLNQLDGITVDGDGNYYVSSWGTNAVYMFDSNFENEPIEISNGHYSPADIFYNITNNILLVPNFNFNTVDFIYINNKDTDSDFNPYQLNIFPNPNNGLFTITYMIEDDLPISIYIINKSGRILHSIKRENRSVELQEINVDLNSLGISKGVYFVKFVFGDDVYMKRIVVIE